jgi:hypothetical protein
MKNNKGCNPKIPDNKKTCLVCKEKYHSLIQNFLDKKIGYTELRQAMLEINKDNLQ